MNQRRQQQSSSHSSICTRYIEFTTLKSIPILTVYVCVCVRCLCIFPFTMLNDLFQCTSWKYLTLTTSNSCCLMFGPFRSMIFLSNCQFISKKGIFSRPLSRFVPISNVIICLFVVRLFVVIVISTTTKKLMTHRRQTFNDTF